MALEGREESNGKARAEDKEGERHVRRGQPGEHAGAWMLRHSSKDAAPERQQSPGGAQEHGNSAMAPRPPRGYIIHSVLLHGTAYIPAEFNIYDSLSALLKTLYLIVGWGGRYRNIP